MKFRRVDLVFVVLIPVVLLVLWLLTTEQTTLRIPLDDEHAASLHMYRAEGKKAAEETCRTCHGDDRNPLSEDHPPEYRCMFCHKFDHPADIPPGVSGPQAGGGQQP
jgi:hypothetical protein